METEKCSQCRFCDLGDGRELDYSPSGETCICKIKFEIINSNDMKCKLFEKGEQNADNCY